jgi:predicted  nucleic acid-binding Zn-ribbon protein
VKKGRLLIFPKQYSWDGKKLDEKLTRILKIQSIDIRFDEIEREKKRIPRELEKQREELDFLKKTIEGDVTVLEGLKDDRRKGEKELEEVEAKYKRSKTKLDEVKSNKEYQAMMKEIETIKALASEKEEIVIMRMEDIELQEAECAKNNAQLEKAQKEYKEKERQYQEMISELEKEMLALTRERNELSQRFDGDLLTRYTRLRGHLRGRVVVPVQDAVCQGCHLGIPPQQYNILLKGDSPQICPHCSRVIYCEDDEGIE